MTRALFRVQKIVSLERGTGTVEQIDGQNVMAREKMVTAAESPFGIQIARTGCDRAKLAVMLTAN